MADDTVDAGFDDVIAGNIYVAPEDKPAPPAPEPEITATVTTLDAAGRDAAKALIQLPPLTASDLARLARDMAMDIKERSVVIKAFGLTETQYEYLEAHNDFYRQAYHAACIEWHAPLSTQERIKVEAAAILEDSLVDLGARMRNKAEGLPGVVEAAKLFAKVAGVGERETGAGAPGERFTINIDLGGDQKITVGSAATPTSPVSGPVVVALPDGSKA